jgi:hypothetical protein
MGSMGQFVSSFICNQFALVLPSFFTKLVHGIHRLSTLQLLVGIIAARFLGQGPRGVRAPRSWLPRGAFWWSPCGESLIHRRLRLLSPESIELMTCIQCYMMVIDSFIKSFR